MAILDDNKVVKVKALVRRPYILKPLLTILFAIVIVAIVSITQYRDTVLENADIEEGRISTDKKVEDTDIPIVVEEKEEEIAEEVDIEKTPVEEPANETPKKDPVITTNPNPINIPEEEPKVIPQPEPEPEPEIVPELPSAFVAFYADNQSDTDQEDINHQRVVNNILNSGANPVVSAGDIMEDGTQDSLDRFNSVTSTLRSTRTFYSALGNNDRKIGDSGTPSQLFLDNFVFPNNEKWYSVNYGNLHLVILDSAFSAGSQTQLNWLANDLQSSDSQNRITGVVFHHPTFATSISSQLINYGVDFVITGHYHAYNHTSSNGIHYFVLGGQPSLEYIVARIYSDRVEISAYNSGNAIIENVNFSER